MPVRKVHKMNKWIYIEDRIPEEGQEVFYYFKYFGVCSGRFEQIDIGGEFGGQCMVDVFHGRFGWLTDDVTHWMPRVKGMTTPESPKIDS